MRSNASASGRCACAGLASGGSRKARKRPGLCRALELGINLIDTADAYGPEVNEWQIAEALYPYPEDLVIATKGGVLDPDETSGCPKDGLSIYAGRAREALGACAWSA